MRVFHPKGEHSRTPMATDCNRAWERSRFLWRIGQPGDPALLLTAFLASHGLGLPALSPLASVTEGSHYSHSVCGARLFVSAAAGASLIGAAAGAPRPAPAVSGLVGTPDSH